MLLDSQRPGQCTCVHTYTCNMFWTETADITKSLPCPGGYVGLPSSGSLPQAPMDLTARQLGPGRLRQSGQATASSGRKCPPPPIFDSPVEPCNFSRHPKKLSAPQSGSLHSPVTLEEGGQASQGQRSTAVVMRPQICPSKGNLATQSRSGSSSGLLGNWTGHGPHSCRQLPEVLTEQDLSKLKNKFWPS